MKFSISHMLAGDTMRWSLARLQLVISSQDTNESWATEKLLDLLGVFKECFPDP